MRRTEITEAKATRLLTESDIEVLAQDSDVLHASVNEALVEQLLHTLIYWKTQCKMAVQEIGDLRSLTVGEMPNASFVESYREVLAKAKAMKAALRKILGGPFGDERSPFTFEDIKIIAREGLEGRR